MKSGSTGAERTFSRLRARCVCLCGVWCVVCVFGGEWNRVPQHPAPQIPNKTRRDCVAFYYLWKKVCLPSSLPIAPTRRPTPSNFSFQSERGDRALRRKGAAAMLTPMRSPTRPGFTMLLVVVAVVVVVVVV